jgi:hypothetical protein
MLNIFKCYGRYFQRPCLQEVLVSKIGHKLRCPRGCSQSSEPDESAREMDKRQKRRGEFVVSGGDASEMLQTCKEALDQIASAIERAVEFSRCEAIGARRYNRFGTSRLDGGHETVGVVGLVGHDSLTRQILDQCRSTADIGDLPRRAKEVAPFSWTEFRVS